MRMVDKFRYWAVLAGLACLLSLPLASWAQRDPIGLHQRPGRHEHSGDSQRVMQQYYGSGHTYFRGNPSTVDQLYGATLLPYGMPAGDYVNRAPYPLQLSVQSTPRLGGGTADNPCYMAQVKIGSAIVGQAAGVPCSAVVSTFTVTVPSGAVFELIGGTAQVTASTLNGNWRATGIVFETERRRVNPGSCEEYGSEGLILYNVMNNLDVWEEEVLACPGTPLRPLMPPGVGYGSLGYRLLLVIFPIVNYNPVTRECWRMTVKNEVTGTFFYDNGSYSPSGICQPTGWESRIMIPVNTRFSVQGANTEVIVQAFNASWGDTGIVFPVGPAINISYGACFTNASGARVRTRTATFNTNQGGTSQTHDEEACPP